MVTGSQWDGATLVLKSQQPVMRCEHYEGYVLGVLILNLSTIETPPHHCISKSYIQILHWNFEIVERAGWMLPEMGMLRWSKYCEADLFLEFPPLMLPFRVSCQTVPLESKSCSMQDLALRTLILNVET